MIVVCDRQLKFSTWKFPRHEKPTAMKGLVCPMIVEGVEMLASLYQRHGRTSTCLIPSRHRVHDRCNNDWLRRARDVKHISDIIKRHLVMLIILEHDA